MTEVRRGYLLSVRPQLRLIAQPVHHRQGVIRPVDLVRQCGSAMAAPAATGSKGTEFHSAGGAGFPARCSAPLPAARPSQSLLGVPPVLRLAAARRPRAESVVPRERRRPNHLRKACVAEGRVVRRDGGGMRRFHGAESVGVKRVPAWCPARCAVDGGHATAGRERPCARRRRPRRLWWRAPGAGIEANRRATSPVPARRRKRSSPVRRPPVPVSPTAARRQWRTRRRRSRR